MKQQSKALRLLFYHLRHTFLVSTQPVAFVKVLVGLLVGGCSVIHLSPVCECCIKKNFEEHCCQPQQCSGYIQSGSSPSMRSLVRFVWLWSTACSARCCVHSYTLSTRIPCLGRFDLSIFVLDFAQMEPLVPLRSFSQLGPSPRTTCFKLQTVFIFEFKWEGWWLCSRRPCNLSVCHCSFEALCCWPLNLPALAFSFLSEGLR